MREKTARAARWSRWRRLTPAEARLAVEYWRGELGVAHSVRLERIRCHQVTNEQGAAGCSLVGVVCGAETACIYHTRALTPEDIIHELLHVANPGWPETSVVLETDRLFARQDEDDSRPQRASRSTPAEAPVTSGPHHESTGGPQPSA